MNTLISTQDDFREEALEIEVEPRTFVQVEFGGKPFEVRHTSLGAEVFHRGMCLDLDVAERLLARYRADIEAGDWWSPFAAELARQLQAAIEERDALV